MLNQLFFKTLIIAIVMAVSGFGSRAATERALPAGAYITDILTDPAQPDAVWVATNGAGCYFRETVSSPWMSVNSATASGKWYTIAAHPQGGEPLFGGEQSGPELGPNGESLTVLDLIIATDAPHRVHVLTPSGVWQVDSVENFEDAAHWRQVFDYIDWQAHHRKADWPEGPWSFTRFQKLTRDPHAPQRLFIGARWEGGYFRSDDGGQTWSHHSISGLFRRVDEFQVDPFNSQLHYAFTHHQGLFKSYNGGLSWVAAGRGLEPQKRTPEYGAYLLCGVAFDANTPGRLIAGSDYSTWISSDYGENWLEVDRTLSCEFVRATAFHPSNPQIIYAGSNVGFFQSLDGGVTWEPANAGFPERRVQKRIEIPIEGQRFEFALVQGTQPVWRRAVDAGPSAQWHSMNWLLQTAATDLEWNSEEQCLVLTGTDGAQYRSQDGGFRWSVGSVAYTPRALQFEADEVPDWAQAGELIIQNAVRPDAEPLLDWYKRPPFIVVQGVRAGYPKDESEPIWEVHWEDQLSGPFPIPDDATSESFDIYVEVRDFQDGTRSGRAPFAGRDRVTQVMVYPVHREP
jgi:hypothetical protein